MASRAERLIEYMKESAQASVGQEFTPMRDMTTTPAALRRKLLSLDEVSRARWREAMAQWGVDLDRWLAESEEPPLQ